MSGKRAKPSPWRFLRLVPVALVAMVVCAMLGLVLLLQDPGADQAPNAGIDPFASGSKEPGASGPASSPADSPSPPATASPADQTTAAQRRDASTGAGPSPETQAPKVRVRRASASVTAPQHAPQSTKTPTPEATVPVAGPARDNPGKKKGLRKGHGPHGHPNR